MIVKTGTGILGALLLLFLLAAGPAAAAVFVKYDGVDGESRGPDGTGNKDWFIVDSFSFGIEREMKESGEKGGTQDINIGVGELQECTMTKSLDLSSGKLAQAAASGQSLGKCEVCFTTSGDTGEPPACYLHYVMERCYVKSWSTSGDADDRPTEEVAFYYNKIAFGYVDTDEDGVVREESMSWDRKRNRPWRAGLRGIFDILFSPGPR